MEWTFDLEAIGVIDVRLAAGRVDVVVAAEGRVRVEATDADADRLIVERTGSNVSVRQTSSFLSRSVAVTITVPAGSDLRVGGGALDVAMAGELGEVTVKTASGDIRLDHARRARLSTASGDVHVGSVDGDITISGASADLYVGSVGGDLEITLASGDARAGCVSGNARVSTVSGDVWLDRVDGGLIEMKSISGDLQVGLPAGSRVHADLTSMTGTIHTPERDADAAPANRQVRVTGHTASGDIRIDRA